MGRASSGTGGDAVDEGSGRDAQDPGEQCWEQLGDGQPGADLAGRGAERAGQRGRTLGVEHRGLGDEYGVDGRKNEEDHGDDGDHAVDPGE